METEDQIITFETYYDPMLAHIIRTRLEDAGIQCFIADENSLLINPLYNQALSGLKIKIFAHDLERCKAILAEDTATLPEQHLVTDPETSEVLICPYCGSTNVERRDLSERRAGISGFVINLFADLFNFFSTKEWHCCNCRRNF